MTAVRKGVLMVTAATAFTFVLLIGIVNLFADFTYEGGRSIMGPFLGTLGASATVVGVVAGFGELLGYSLRSISGFLADKTHRYWIVTFVGYAVNMLAVPALALAGSSRPHDCRAHRPSYSTPGGRNHVVVYRSTPR